jgi:hypothetical protein
MIKINKSFWRSRNLFSKRFLAAGGMPLLRLRRKEYE